MAGNTGGGGLAGSLRVGKLSLRLGDRWSVSMGERPSSAAETILAVKRPGVCPLAPLVLADVDDLVSRNCASKPRNGVPVGPVGFTASPTLRTRARAAARTCGGERGEGEGARKFGSLRGVGAVCPGVSVGAGRFCPTRRPGPHRRTS